MTSFTTVLRWLFRLVVGLYFVAALAVLALRYAVLPRIDEWRPQIEVVASRMLDTPVRVGAIAADWKGLHPRLRFDQLRIDDEQGQTVLAVPQARATLSWRSVLLLEPRLLSLEVSEPDVAIRRDGASGLWLAGRSVSNDDATEGGDNRSLRWLLSQRELVVRDATLRWTDEQRDESAELVLADVQMHLRNTLLGSRFVFTAKPPAERAARMTLQFDVKHDLLSLRRDDPKAWSGEVYAQIDDAVPTAWQSWLDVPVHADRLAARIWLDIKHGEASWATLDLALRGVDWQRSGGETASDRRLQADALDVRLEGEPQDLLAPTGVAAPLSLAARVTARGVTLALPGAFDPPVLPVQSLTMNLGIERDGRKNWTLRARQLDLSNADVSARLQGVWRSAGRTPAGTLDLQGQASRAALNAIHRYLPVALHENVRGWLRSGLLSGQANGVSLSLRGDVADLPFGEAAQFHVAGSFRDATVDYAPARKDSERGWPKLEQLNGTFDLTRAALTLRAQGGRVRTGPQSLVKLERTTAEFPNLISAAPMLHINGNTSGQAQDYLAMMRESPLGGLLGNAFAQTRAAGTWRVPLRLAIPLFDAQKTKVQGQIRFADGSLTLHPDAPALNGVNGTLAFSESGATADGLRARLLGGTVQVSGELSRGAKGFDLTGSLRADALFKQWPIPALQRLSGQTDYTASVVWQQSGAIDVTLESSLAGLASQLPAPLNKAAHIVLPLKASWGAGRNASSGRWLDVRLGNRIDLLLEQAQTNSDSYFRRGSLGMYRGAPSPTSGLSLDFSPPEFDLGVWADALKLFTLPVSQGGSPQRPLLPAVQTVRLRSAAVHLPLMTLRDVVLNAEHGQAGWQTDLHSHAAAGSWSWRAATAKTPSRLVGRFEHLILGDSGRDGEASFDNLIDAKTIPNFPELDLAIKNFSLYERELGELTLTGSYAERGKRWRVDHLKIVNPDATLSATGLWRLLGDDRGLALDTKLEVADLGRLLARLGDTDRVSGARGSATATLRWRNLPWQFRYDDLTGSMALALEQGVFSRMNSASARLLELLSLQSLTSLAKLDVDPGAAFRDGFRFNSLLADVKVTGGIVHTERFNIDSPIAAIALTGDTDLASQNWNLEAAVVPKLDASGAAIAASVINPLVGLGAFLTQWLLKEPLARALTARYTVTGTWTEPVIAPLKDKSPPSPADNERVEN